MNRQDNLFPWLIKDVIKEVEIKKRTLIFWIKEYELENLMTHSNAGNTYSDRAVKYLKIIKLLKDRAWFSADFIKIIIKRLLEDESRNPLSDLDLLEDLGKRLCSMLGSVIPKNTPKYPPKNIPTHSETLKPSKVKESIIPNIHIQELKKLEEKIENFPESPEYADWLFTAAEICKEQIQDFSRAIVFYKKLITSNSEYSQIAKIYLEILENM